VGRSAIRRHVPRRAAGCGGQLPVAFADELLCEHCALSVDRVAVEDRRDMVNTDVNVNMNVYLSLNVVVVVNGKP
jgi:hypothetical protein